MSALNVAIIQNPENEIVPLAPGADHRWSVRICLYENGKYACTLLKLSGFHRSKRAAIQAGKEFIGKVKRLDLAKGRTVS